MGRTIREIFPKIETNWVVEMAQVVETGRSASFTRQVGSLHRWYEGRAHRVDADRFAVIFVEITERRRIEASRAALLELGDRLRDMQSPATMSRIAAEALGPTLEADHAGYCLYDAREETAVVESAWAPEGHAALAGSYHLGELGSVLDDLLKGETVSIADVRLDPRTAARAERLEALGVRALLSQPLIERNRLVAFFFAQTTAPRHWTESDAAFMRTVAERTWAAMERRRAEHALRDLTLLGKHGAVPHLGTGRRRRAAAPEPEDGGGRPAHRRHRA